MNLKDQLSDKQWTALLTSIHQSCQVYWGPTDVLCRQILEKSFVHAFETIAPLMENHLHDELVELRSMTEGFSSAADLFAYLEKGYLRLFINDRGKIAAPLYASCYEDMQSPSLMGAAALRMQAVLAELGIQKSEDVCEPPDHLSIELELLYYLLTRHKKSGRLKGLSEAAYFAAEFLIPWVQVFNQRLAQETHCRFYPLTTSVLLSILRYLAMIPHSNGPLRPK